MHINLEISSLSVHTHAGRKVTDDSPAPGLIRFGVHPSDDEHLDLETGETFSNPAYATLRRSKDDKPQAIRASLAVIKARSEEDFAKNTMHYHAPVEIEHEGTEPSSLSFNVFVSAAEFDELLANLRHGLIPSGISVSLAWTLDGKVLTFGWEPDGSGKKWANAEKANRRIAIEGILIGYDVRKQEIDKETFEPVIVAADDKSAALAAIAERLVAIESRTKVIAQLLGAIFVILIAALLLPNVKL